MQLERARHASQRDVQERLRRSGEGGKSSGCPEAFKSQAGHGELHHCEGS